MPILINLTALTNDLPLIIKLELMFPILVNKLSKKFRICIIYISFFYHNGMFLCNNVNFGSRYMYVYSIVPSRSKNN